MLHDRRSSRQQPLQQLLSDFLAATDWALLCQRLLPLLPGRGLLEVACIAARDAHRFEVQRQQPKQQQERGLGRDWERQRQGRDKQDGKLLLSAWCSKQGAYWASHAAAAAAAAAPRAPSIVAS